MVKDGFRCLVAKYILMDFECKKEILELNKLVRLIFEKNQILDPYMKIKPKIRLTSNGVKLTRMDICELRFYIMYYFLDKQCKLGKGVIQPSISVIYILLTVLLHTRPQNSGRSSDYEHVGSEISWASLSFNLLI